MFDRTTLYLVTTSILIFETTRSHQCQNKILIFQPRGIFCTVNVSKFARLNKNYTVYSAIRFQDL